jgi:hypothetical protein
MHAAPANPHRPRKQAVRQVYSVSCADCEDTVFNLEPVLPDHWQVADVDGEPQAYCPACTRNLPETAR